MTKRLQVLLDEDELADIKRAAGHQRQSVAQWVRAALRQAREADAGRPPSTKLRLLREAAAHEFPTAAIDVMLEEIEQGYRD